MCIYYYYDYYCHCYYECMCVYVCVYIYIYIGDRKGGWAKSWMTSPWILSRGGCSGRGVQRIGVVL